MTVIAYRDGVMASDKQVTIGDGVYGGDTAKVAKTQRFLKDGYTEVLMGAAGNPALCEWIFRQAKDALKNAGDRLMGAGMLFTPGNFALYEDIQNTSCILVQRRWRAKIKGGLLLIADNIMIIENVRHGHTYNAPFYADGSGYRFALAAMEMGATAKKAVEVANKLDVNCSGLVSRQFSTTEQLEKM